MKILLAIRGRFDNLFIVYNFIATKVGREYGITRLQKLKLARRIIKNHRKIKSLTTWQQHVLLVEEIFRVPKLLKGDIVECGCYNGASTVNLSLACALTNRSLFVCDSFEGLPTPKNDEEYEDHLHSSGYYSWKAGDFSSEGGLDTVKKNIKKFCNIKVCQFVKGYYKDTLKNIKTDSIVLIFEDCDLPSSVEDCLRYLWPKIQEGCKFYCHEPWSINVISLFYDKEWWKNNLNISHPGFYGSGFGIKPYSNIGYAIKHDVEKIKKSGKRIVHLGSKGFKG